MRYLALACDYDGTIAHHGRVDEPTRAALERFRASGRKLILVTGRRLEDLMATFPFIDLFEHLVVENGALLYLPATKEEKPLADPPPPQLVATLMKRGVAPLSVGRSILATWTPHETQCLEAIRDLGLAWQVIFNKGAVMLLPSGVNKATGLAASLKLLGLSPHNVAAVGDAENDHALLRMVECSAAVANALPLVKEQADVNTPSDHGAGVVELMEDILANDLAGWEHRLTRHHILLGTESDGREVSLRPFGTNVLLAGPSASGKSTTATAIMERLGEHGYQYCVFDPEGDYEKLQGAMVLGDSKRPPVAAEVIRLLEEPETNSVVNLIGLPLADRPEFFRGLFASLQEMRSRCGRPHWIVLDEVHHLLPASWQSAEQSLFQNLDRILMITVHPNEVSPTILTQVDTVIAVGKEADTIFGQVREMQGQPAPTFKSPPVESGEVLLWRMNDAAAPVLVRVTPGKTERFRHSRKYAEGQLPPERSFYFQGPEGKLNLQAQNLILFLQIARGVDEATWLHHLRKGDYSQWFRDVIKDEALAEEAAAVERQNDLGAAESLSLIQQSVEQRYTLPADAAPAP